MNNLKSIKMKKITFFLLVICLTTMACKKDYRDKWVGDWDFVVERSWRIWCTDHWDIQRDTIYHSGEINLIGIDSLIIEYMETVTMHVDEIGNLSKGNYPYNYAHGHFEKNDKIYLRTGYDRQRPGDWDHIINGIKKKGSRK